MMISEERKREIEGKLLEAAYRGVALADELPGAGTARKVEILEEIAATRMIVSMYKEALL